MKRKGGKGRSFVRTLGDDDARQWYGVGGWRNNTLTLSDESVGGARLGFGRPAARHLVGAGIWRYRPSAGRERGGRNDVGTEPLPDLPGVCMYACVCACVRAFLPLTFVCRSSVAVCFPMAVSTAVGCPREYSSSTPFQFHFEAEGAPGRPARVSCT